MAKKAQSISINTVIVAAIAIAVLVVTIVIFSRQSSTTVKNLDSCELKGGRCAESLTSNKNLKPGQKPGCSDPEYNVPVYINDPKCGTSGLCCLKILT